MSWYNGIGTPAKQTFSLDPAGVKYLVLFVLIISPFPSSTSFRLSSCVVLPLIWNIHTTLDRQPRAFPMVGLFESAG